MQLTATKNKKKQMAGQKYDYRSQVVLIIINYLQIALVLIM